MLCRDASCPDGRHYLLRTNDPGSQQSHAPGGTGRTHACALTMGRTSYLPEAHPRYAVHGGSCPLTLDSQVSGSALQAEVTVYNPSDSLQTLPPTRRLLGRPHF